MDAVAILELTSKIMLVVVGTGSVFAIWFLLKNIPAEKKTEEKDKNL